MESNKKNFCHVSELSGFTCGAPSMILSQECKYYEKSEHVWCKFNKIGEYGNMDARHALVVFTRENIFAKWLWDEKRIGMEVDK